MGAAYPPISGERLLARAGHMLEARQYVRARAEYLSLSQKLKGIERDQALVRVGAVDYLNNRTREARRYLRDLQPASEAEAERLYYLAECARRLDDDDAMMAAVRRLNAEFPQSSWRLKALVTAANIFLLVNQPDEYVPLYRAAYQSFPLDPSAGLYHWKVTFQSYLRNTADA